MTRLRRPTALQLVRLEARDVPAIWGNPWPDPENLTVSFVPDGTAMRGGESSDLFARLNTIPEAVWQAEMLRAFQAWSAVTNVSVSVMADAGRPLGEAGPIQGSPHYGDIRIAARPLSSSELAMATPFDLIGAGAGDIVLNSQAAFTQGGVGGPDLFTVALQEAGHALGLPNSADPGSVMFTRYSGPKAGLSAGDVAAIQKMYGVRAADRFEKNGNNSLGDYQEMTFVANGLAVGATPTAGDKPLVAAGDLTTSSDKDVYMMKSSKTTTGFFVELRTTGVSMLNARVSVYNKDKVLVKSAAATDPRTGDLSVFVSNPRKDSEYYVEVKAAGTKFSTGRYRLAVGHDALAAVNPAVAGGLLSPDRGTNDTRSAADAMSYVSFDQLDTGGSGSKAGSGSGLVVSPDARWDYLDRASIETATDKDWYKVTSAGNFAGGVLVAVVSATEAGKLDPEIRAYDAAGNRLTVDVLGNDASTYSIQVRGVTAGKTYYLEVVSAGTEAPALTGSYVLAADFRTKAVDFTTLMAGTLTGTASQTAGRIDVAHGRTYHLSLSAADVPGAAAVRATVYDAAGQVVASFMARDGETVATDVPLAAGTYTIKLSAAGAAGATLPNLGYTLKGFIRNDPISPKADDPTEHTTTVSPEPEVYLFDFVSWVYFVDDYSDPWFGV